MHYAAVVRNARTVGTSFGPRRRRSRPAVGRLYALIAAPPSDRFLQEDRQQRIHVSFDTNGCDIKSFRLYLTNQNQILFIYNVFN